MSHELTNKEASLPLLIKIGWGIGELAIAFYIGVTMAFFLFYLTEALTISPIWAGIALLIPRLWDAITDPFMGALSDRTNSRMGRRRPYLLVGSFVFGIAFWLVLTPPPFDSELGRIAYFTFMYIVVSTAYTIYDVPYSAMVAEMCSSYKARTNLVSYKMIAARSGIILAAIVSPLVYNSRETLTEGFALLGIVGGLFITATGLIAFFATANAPRVKVIPEKFSLREELAAIISNRPFANLFVVFFFQNLAIGATATTLIYFVTIVMQVSQNLIGPLFAVAGITALLATPGWVIVSGRIGKKSAYARAIIINMVAALAMFFLPVSLAMLIFGIYLINGIADAGNQLMSNSMVPDTVEVDELLTGKRREGAIFGAWAFCRKAGMAGGAFLTAMALGLFGFVSGGIEQPASAILGVRIAFAGLPLLLWFAAYKWLTRYDLTEERFNEIQNRIGRS